MRTICKTKGMPSEFAVRRWALEDTYGFAAEYARARLVGWHSWADEAIDASRERCIGETIVEKADGSIETTTFDDVKRSRLRVDTLKWALSKMLPKVYGQLEKMADDGDGGKIVIEGGLPE